mgnify:CR=1 FL=1
MKNLITSLLENPWRLISNGFLDISFGLICSAELYYCGLWTWQAIYQPMAAAPGSRDSAALLIVGMVVLGIAMFAWALLAGFTLRVMHLIFPNWEHVLIDY